MKTPAAMARIAMTTPSPPKAGTNAAKPVRMSQMDSKRKPIFFVIFMIVLLFLTIWMKRFVMVCVMIDRGYGGRDLCLNGTGLLSVTSLVWQYDTGFQLIIFCEGKEPD